MCLVLNKIRMFLFPCGGLIALDSTLFLLHIQHFRAVRLTRIKIISLGLCLLNADVAVKIYL